MTASLTEPRSTDRLPAMVALFGALLVLLAFYPGYMSNDSFSQLHQARTGMVGDNHPPFLVGFWMAAEWLVIGPFVMLLGQVAVFWSGLLRLARATFPTRPVRATAVILMGFYPPVFGILGTLWKDVWMAGFLLWAVALTLAFRGTKRAGVGAGALVAMGLAIAMRHNAIAAVVPCATALAWVVATERRPAVRPLVRAGVAAVAGVAVSGGLVVTMAFLASPIVDVHGHFWQVVADYDLAGISTAVGEDLFPEDRLRPGATIDDVVETYSPRSLLPLFRARCAADTLACKALITQSRDGADAEFDALKRAWLDAVTGHPGAYASHRVAVFRELIGISDEPVWVPFYAQRFVKDLEFATPQAPLSRVVDRVIVAATRTPIYLVWIYALALLAAVGATLWGARRGRDVWTLGLLSASGSLYLLSYLPLAPSPDFRYSHWPILAAMICAVVVVPSRRSGETSH